MKLAIAIRSGARAAVVAIALVAAPLLLPLAVLPTSAYAADALQDEGRAAVAAWIKAVTSGDVAVLDAILAPDFQILRADGSRYDRAGYLKSDLPKIVSPPDLQGLVVTGAGDTLVASYILSIRQTRDGKAVEVRAPRLTVFRKSGDTWLVVAHANFADLQ
jgi:ketosteroid isomerase-like protein